MIGHDVSLPHQTRVVVIGGGIAGCSVLYHLTKLGWTDVLLVERNELTSGSTWHSVGNTPMFTSNLNLLRLLKYSNELYASLEAETGQAIGYHRVGSLRLATNRDLLLWYKQIEAMARLADVRFEILSVDEALELNPFVNPEGVLAASYLHGDGYLDPSNVTHALARGARLRGGQIARGVRVERLTQRRDGSWEVQTSRGAVAADIVVNAAGQWGREIGAMVGVKLPLVPMEHHYLVTEAIPALKQLKHELPVTRDPERVFYLRQEGDGLLIGFFEANPVPWSLDGIPPDFAQQLLPSRFEHIEPDLARAVERIPILGDVGIMKLVNGPDAYTPDGAPIVGPVPGVRNMFVIAGFSLFGIANAGGVGRGCAEWIVNGEPSIDLWDYDVRRFGDYAARKSYLVAKAIEAYSMDYAVHYPHQERAAGRPVKTSPVHDLLSAQGAVFGARHGWERPLWFAPPGVEPRDELTFYRPNWHEHVAAECRAVRERVGILDQTSFGKFEVSGKGALEWLNRVCANQIDVPIGKIVVTEMLNAHGGIECDLTVTRLSEDSFWVVTAAATTTHDLGWIEQNLPQDGSVMVRNVSDEYAVLSLMGPYARHVLQQVADEDVSNRAFPFMSSQQITIGAAPVRAFRLSYVGELGWELYMPLAYQREVYRRLFDAGKQWGIVNFGYRALDSLRIEKGYRLWGLDINPLTTPLQAGLERFVAFDKPDFVGKQALLEPRARGVDTVLCGRDVECETVIPHGWEPVYCGDKPISYVCSGERGHYVGKTLALAYLPVELAEVGTKLSVKLLGASYAATVIKLPVYDPTNARMRQ